VLLVNNVAVNVALLAALEDHEFLHAKSPLEWLIAALNYVGVEVEERPLAGQIHNCSHELEDY
jgi:hypothetical protein